VYELSVQDVYSNDKLSQVKHLTMCPYPALFLQEIFGPETEYELIPAETPVEQLSVNGQSRHEKEPGKS
jgi:hypothetical protein